MILKNKRIRLKFISSDEQPLGEVTGAFLILYILAAIKCKLFVCKEYIGNNIIINVAGK